MKNTFNKKLISQVAPPERERTFTNGLDNSATIPKYKHKRGSGLLITKNTYGVTSIFEAKRFDLTKKGELGGSSLNRKPETEEQFINRILNKPLFPEEKKERQPRSMSRRTKAKIRRKVLAFARLHKKLSFVTLTFVNKVEEDHGVKVLGKFLENVSKGSKDFQYLWVAEKQMENEVFKDNLHFHLITNKYWKIERWWNYWLQLQAKHGIVPREAGFKPSSAFDVRAVTSTNVKAIGNYLTHYVTKNEGQFMCQLWNCSKKVSQLYTDFYDDLSFVRKVDVLEAKGLLGGERKKYEQEYCHIHTIPLNKITMNLYRRLDEKNQELWNREKEGGVK